MRVLLLEDDWLQAMALECILTGAGHEVVGVATDAIRAIDLARETKPDLLIADVRLRGSISGTAAAMTIFGETGARALFVTGNPRETAAAAECRVGVVEKPYRDTVLLHAVGEAARRIAPMENEASAGRRTSPVA